MEYKKQVADGIQILLAFAIETPTVQKKHNPDRESIAMKHVKPLTALAMSTFLWGCANTTPKDQPTAAPQPNTPTEQDAKQDGGLPFPPAVKKDGKTLLPVRPMGTETCSDDHAGVTLQTIVYGDKEFIDALPEDKKAEMFTAYLEGIEKFSTAVLNDILAQPNLTAEEVHRMFEVGMGIQIPAFEKGTGWTIEVLPFDIKVDPNNPDCAHGAEDHVPGAGMQ